MTRFLRPKRFQSWFYQIVSKFTWIYLIWKLFQNVKKSLHLVNDIYKSFDLINEVFNCCLKNAPKRQKTKLIIYQTKLEWMNWTRKNNDPSMFCFFFRTTRSRIWRSWRLRTWTCTWPTTRSPTPSGSWTTKSETSKTKTTNWKNLTENVLHWKNKIKIW